MTQCCEKIYKFDKGKQLSTSNDKHGGTWESYELLITYTDGTIIGTVHSDYMHYNVATYRGAIVSQNLSGGDNSYSYGNVHDLSVELNKDGQFIITGSSEGAFTPPVIGRDNMTLTDYGEEVLGECFTGTLEVMYQLMTLLISLVVRQVVKQIMNNI